MRIGRLLTIAAASALAAGCQVTENAGNEAGGNAAGDSSTGGNAQGQASRTIADTAAHNAALSEFNRAVEAAGLAETLRGAGPYTVFAPVDAAFGQVPQETRTRLMAPEGRERLTQLLTAHIVPGVVTSQDLTSAMERGGGRATLATVSGVNLIVAREGDSLTVTDPGGARARVTQADDIQSNGVIHHVDTVLMPAGGGT